MDFGDTLKGAWVFFLSGTYARQPDNIMDFDATFNGVLVWVTFSCGTYAWQPVKKDGFRCRFLWRIGDFVLCGTNAWQPGNNMNFGVTSNNGAWVTFLCVGRMHGNPTKKLDFGAAFDCGSRST